MQSVETDNPGESSKVAIPRLKRASGTPYHPRERQRRDRVYVPLLRVGSLALMSTSPDFEPARAVESGVGIINSD